MATALEYTGLGALIAMAFGGLVTTPGLFYSPENSNAQSKRPAKIMLTAKEVEALHETCMSILDPDSQTPLSKRSVAILLAEPERATNCIGEIKKQLLCEEYARYNHPVQPIPANADCEPYEVSIGKVEFTYEH